MIFTKWIGQRDITTIYGMCPSKLDEEMLLDMLWCIAKATKRFKNETRKCRKKNLFTKKNRNNIATLAAVDNGDFSFVFVSIKKWSN